MRFSMMRELFLSRQGKVARLPFFVAIMVLAVCCGLPVLAIGFTAVIIDPVTIEDEASLWAFLCLMMGGLLLFGFAFYSSASLVAKRLRDIGHSGAHVFWMIGLSLINSILIDVAHPNVIFLIAMILLIETSIFVFLISMPGKRPEFYDGVFD